MHPSLAGIHTSDVTLVPNRDDQYRDAVYRGVIIEESLLDRAPLATITIVHSKRFDITDPTEGQPPVWTVTDFEVDDARAADLAAALASSLSPGPWYIDYNNGDHTFVVFASRVFGYERGDTATLEQARQHAVAVGVPASQIDWAVPE